MGNIISINKQYLTRHCKNFNEEPKCSRCTISFIVGDKAFRTKKNIYCLPCYDIIYFDSSEEINDEDLDNFFKIV